MSRPLRVVVCLIAAALSRGGAASGEEPDSMPALEILPAAEALPALARKMLNALPGDASVWARCLSDQTVYVSEAGDVMNKTELLAGFGPFPPGIDGSIELKNPRITEFGDVAIMVFEAHEKQKVFGQAIEVNYLSTHVWRREEGRWRLIAAHSGVLARDPQQLPIDTSGLDACVGTYELSGARRYKVERRGDSLIGGPENGELKPLIAVGDNVFAESGSPLGILRIFVAEPDGQVRRMVQRRKFADVNWLRVPDKHKGGGQDPG